MKLSVSTIAMLLTKPEMLFNGVNVEAIELGRMIHQKVYPRRQNKLSMNVDGVQVVGYPDHIENGIVEELKIVNGNNSDWQMEHAYIQANIYCYLAGLHRYRIRLFDVSALKEEHLEFEADHDNALQNIRRAIGVQKQLYEVLRIPKI